MSDTLFRDLLVEKPPWRKRFSAAAKEEYVSLWTMYLWGALILLGVAIMAWSTGNETGLIIGAYVSFIGLNFLCVFGIPFLWSRLRMRPTYDNDRELDQWSLKRKLKDSQVIAAERMDRFELAALLGPKHYQVLAIDKQQKQMYNFVLNPFMEPERALRVVGEKLKVRAAKYDKARREEEAKERVAKQLAEKILADI